MARVTGFLTAIIATLAISGTALSQSAMQGPSTLTQETAENLSKLHASAWAAACRLKRFDCTKLPMPKIGYALLASDYGTYRVNGDIVLVDIRLVGQEFGAAVLVHEMIHYIQDRQRPLSNGLITAAQSCADEEEAFTLVFNLHLTSKLAAGDARIRTWSEARPSYPHCNPFFRPYPGRMSEWE